MKTKVIDVLDSICEEIDAYVKDDYSGRGMFGRQCLAVSVPEFIPFLERAAKNGLTGAKIDNLGLGYVIYWPKYDKDSEIVLIEDRNE